MLLPHCQPILNLSDDEILVTNAQMFPTPNPTLGKPGIVFINGEKIVIIKNTITQNVNCTSLDCKHKYQLTH
jgi:hypothetical protein